MKTFREVEAGFTYIGLLVTVVIMGFMLAAASRVWSVSEQRERETQLLFAGDEIRAAIERYYISSPAGINQYPQSLQDLVDDKRWPVPRRYLRRVYLDPMTGTADWVLVTQPGGTGIMGVVSASKLAPIKRAGFNYTDAGFAGSDCYCSWQFVYRPVTWLRKATQPVSHP